MTSSAPDPAYLPRHLRGAVEAALADTPVVCLLGPRQCGKSTLSRHCEPERHYVSLDDSAYLDLALSDPQGFVDDLPEQVAIDEVQRAPELADWETRLNGFLQLFDRKVLQDAGKVTAELAKAHAESKFEKYRIVQDRLHKRP